MANPPPLPPRQERSPSPSTSATSVDSQSGRPRKETIHLVPQDALRPGSARPGVSPYKASSDSWMGNDPRSSSMVSLRPLDSVEDGRKTLLIVYIHGFMGNETSFRSFPAHVHNLVTLTLAETHRVHTKIYPKYKSRRNISYSVEDFSNWLYPHESPNTDVILVGHSLGGILAAEVALLPSHVPGSVDYLQHRILGVMAFDTPFLGMHPSVIKTGLASLFKPGAEPPKTVFSDLSPISTVPSASSTVSDTDDPFNLPDGDPNFNPAFNNDILLPQRGKIENAWHFWQKHYGNVFQATKTYMTSHLEFGGCLLDYDGLRKRYIEIRKLEDISEIPKRPERNGKLLRRVRFVNYYSASTGRIKQNLEQPSDQVEMSTLTLNPSGQPSNRSRTSLPVERLSSPRLSLEEDVDGLLVQRQLEEVPPMPMDDEPSSTQSLELLKSESSIADSVDSSKIQLNEHSVYDDLPTVPPEPQPPKSFEPSQYSTKDALKLAQKEHQRQVRAYERAKKDRANAARDRDKIIKKRQKVVMKQRSKEANQAEQSNLKESSPKGRDKDHDSNSVQDSPTNEKPERSNEVKKDRKFCSLPRRDPKTGLRDPTWIRVLMEGFDEVTAHTSLFFTSETYAKLVGDAAIRIQEWVEDDLSMMQAILPDYTEATSKHH